MAELRPNSLLHEKESRLLSDITLAVDRNVPLIAEADTTDELKHDAAILMLNAIERLVTVSGREKAYSMLPLDTCVKLAVGMGASRLALAEPPYSGVSNNRLRGEAESIMSYVDRRNVAREA